MLRRFFGAKEVAPETRERVLLYLGNSSGIHARQDDEAGNYNQAMVMHGPSLDLGNNSAHSVAAAAERMAATNRELLEEHGRLGPIPDEAGECFMTWHSTYLALVAWSDAAAAAYRAIADGRMPALDRVGKLLQEEERWKSKALKAQAALVRRMRLTAEEARQLLT